MNNKCRPCRLSSVFLVALLAVAAPVRAESGPSFDLTLRRRAETKDGKAFNAVHRAEKWNAKQTAVIVCDMWDLHHCLNATRRGAEMAPRMNDLLKEARQRGATIIHAPSGCMETYKDHPARRHAQATPRSKSLPHEIGKWCYKIPAEEKGTYPIDQTDGGEDDDLEEHRKWAEKLAAMGRNPKAPWKAQAETLEIKDEDFISDNGEEIWSILEQRNIPNVILVGVHTNMCVLGRPFGLRQLAKNGKNVVLMRDMTDTMYNPLKAPYVSHFTGTDLIVEHIEKYVCSTATSDQILGGEPFVFAGDKRPHVAILIGEPEYHTHETLPRFAVDALGKEFRVSVIHGEPEANELPGLEALRDVDVMFLSIRRRPLPIEQMKRVKELITAGTPVVAIRTASHAFSLRGKPASEGNATWEEFDADVLGGNYTGHHGEGPAVTVTLGPNGKGHPILEGIDLSNLKSQGSLYKAGPVAGSATALLIGSIPNSAAEPVAWINKSRYGGKVFYTSMGHIEDFKLPEFNRLLRNAVAWAAAR